MSFEEAVHLLGTPILVGLYIVRIIILLKVRPARDFNLPSASRWPGVVWAYLTIFMPGALESTRKHWNRYVEFAVFHIGVFSNILMSFLIPYAPGFLVSPVREIFAVLIILSFLMGMIRLVRRVTDPEMRIISTPDDYVSMGLTLLFLGFGIPAVYGSTWALFVYYIISGIFLVYEPFSKIRHYIYFPFARYFYGAQLGKRGLVGKH